MASSRDIPPSYEEAMTYHPRSTAAPSLGPVLFPSIPPAYQASSAPYPTLAPPASNPASAPFPTSAQPESKPPLAPYPTSALPASNPAPAPYRTSIPYPTSALPAHNPASAPYPMSVTRPNQETLCPVRLPIKPAALHLCPTPQRFPPEHTITCYCSAEDGRPCNCCPHNPPPTIREYPTVRTENRPLNRRSIARRIAGAIFSVFYFILFFIVIVRIGSINSSFPKERY